MLNKTTSYRPLNLNWLKLNCDASLKLDEDKIGIDGILRDSNGRLIKGYIKATNVVYHLKERLKQCMP